MKLMIFPQYNHPDKADGGIRRVVEAQVKHLPKYGFEIVSHIRDGDIVATHGAELPDVPIGTPWVCHNHGLYWAEYDWPGWGPRVNRQVVAAMKKADHVTAPSEWVAYALKRGMWLRPTVLHHGIDPEFWEPGENKGYVLWNKARTDPISDPAPMQRLAMMSPDIRFVSTFGIPKDNVAITGKMPFPEAIDYIRHAGVYLATTRETMGIGTLEAMACAVPILGWDWGGQSEVIKHGETGWLSKVGDYDDLRRGLLWCLENRRSVGIAAREDVLNRFTWDKVMASYAELYQKVYEREKGLNEAPKVTIITPCYNLGYLLPSMIQSVKDQTMGDWEVVIVDDHSEDDSFAVAQALADEDSRIRVVRNKENLKLPATLNRGFAESRSRYVMNLDPDNMIPPGTLKVLTDALDNDRSLDIAYGRIRFVLEDGITPDPITGPDTDGISSWPPQFSCLSQFMHRNQIPSTSLSRRDIMERIGGYRDRDTVSEDAAHWTRIVSYGFQPAKVTNALTFVYRYRPDSKSRGEDEPDWTSWFPWAKNALLMPFGVAAKPPDKIGKAWPVPSYEPALVTIIIPVGPGHSRILIDALDSVEAQTFRNWRCIVINDTGEHLSVPHPWVEMYEAKGGEGPGAARNIGIQASKTEVFVCLDADDIMEPECLEEMYGVWKQVGGIVYSQWWDDKGDGDVTVWNPPEWDPTLLVTGQGCIHASCAMYARSAWESVGGFDASMRSWEDWDFQIAYALEGVCATKIDKPLFTYRKTTGHRREEAAPPNARGEFEMRNKWPDMWDGQGKEKLAMACGGCSKRKVERPRPLPVVEVSRPQGAQLVEFLGPGSASTFVGKVTGQKYRFGSDPSHMRKYVYDDDLPGFLEITKLFVLVAPSPELEEGPILAGVMGS